jgi:hypothetical protein
MQPDRAANSANNPPLKTPTAITVADDDGDDDHSGEDEFIDEHGYTIDPLLTPEDGADLASYHPTKADKLVVNELDYV